MIEYYSGYETITPEKEYNNYGQRGFVDLYLRNEKPENTRLDYSDRVIEVKTNPPAIKKCNSIVRQFEKMCNNFYSGTNLIGQFESLEIYFELCFSATQRNMRHLMQNRRIYSSIAENKDNVIRQITIRSKSNPDLVVAASDNLEFGSYTWKNYARCRNQEVYETFLEVD